MTFRLDHHVHTPQGNILDVVASTPKATSSGLCIPATSLPVSPELVDVL